MIIDKLNGSGYKPQYAVVRHSNDTGEVTVESVHDKMSDAVVAALKCYGTVLTIINAVNLAVEAEGDE